MLARLHARLERKAIEHGVTFPPWIPIAASLGMIGVTLAAATQRELVAPPSPPVLAALVIVVVAAAWVLSPVWIPWWVDVATVLPSTAWLLATPIAFGETVDAAPAMLAILAAVVTTTDGVGRGAITVGLAVPVALVAGRPAPLEVPFYVGEIVFGATIGMMLHWQMRALEAERQARQEERERAALAERQRIAHEIHDLVAHSLSVTMLHLTGARRALTEDADVTEAVDALTDAERIGRAAMADIRRTVGLLATEPSAPRPLPGASDLDALVGDFQAAGLSVTWRRTGDLGSLSSTVGLALYRVLQESLANVAKHAPGSPVEVTVAVARHEARLEISNPVPVGARAGTGNGLTGMASRADQLGGSLTCGPDGDRWRVALRLPLASEPAPAGSESDETCRLKRMLP